MSRRSLRAQRSSFLSRLKGHQRLEGGDPPRSLPVRHYGRPRLEPLEDRTLLSVGYYPLNDNLEFYGNFNQSSITPSQYQTPNAGSTTVELGFGTNSTDFVPFVQLVVNGSDGNYIQFDNNNNTQFQMLGGTARELLTPGSPVELFGLTTASATTIDLNQLVNYGWAPSANEVTSGPMLFGSTFTLTTLWLNNVSATNTTPQVEVQGTMQLGATALGMQVSVSGYNYVHFSSSGTTLDGLSGSLVLDSKQYDGFSLSGTVTASYTKPTQTRAGPGRDLRQRHVDQYRNKSGRSEHVSRCWCHLEPGDLDHRRQHLRPRVCPGWGR